MRHTRWLVLLLAGIGLFAGASPAPAQSQKKNYVHFPAEGDLSRILSDKLLEKRGMMELLERLRKNKSLPKNLDLKSLSQNPWWKKEAEKFLNSGKGEHRLKPEEVERLKELWKPPAKPPGTDKASDSKRMHDWPARPPEGPRPGAIPPAPPPPAPEPVAQDPGIQEKLAEWAQQLAEKLEHTRFGEELKNSEKWQEVLRGMEGYLTDPGTGGFRLPGGLGKFGERLRLPDWNLALPDLSRIKLPTPSLPSLPRPDLNVSLPRLSVGGPALGGGLPNVGGGGLAASQALLWAVLAVLVGVLLWRLGARGALARRGPAADWQPGPWPVDPARVATRADLVRAFEYLAVLRLGREARAWNHCEIAGHLGGADSEKDRAAGELASLYEQARYAPDDEPLAASDLDAARRNLCLLAGVATA